MQFFIVFIVGAVILGAGAMLSPAWNTRQPRIGLGAALSLALVMGGAVFWGSLFQWDTLVIDYLLFALVSIVVLGGTLSSAQARAEAKGEELADAQQGWTGPQDLLFFALVIGVFMVPLAILAVPAGLNAPITAYLTLAVREGGSFLSLAPFEPDTMLVFSPGFHALTAYLSGQLEQAIPMVQFAVAAVIAVVSVWTAYDLGGELDDKPLGRAMAATLLGSLSLIGLFISGEFTAMTALLFAFAFMVYTLRFLRHPNRMDLIAGGLMLGAVLYANGAFFLIVLMAYIVWLGTAWIVRANRRNDPTLTPRTWLGLALGIPGVALLGTAPWIADILPLLGRWDGLPSPDQVFFDVLLTWNGIWVYPVALVGLVAAFAGNIPGTRHAATWSLGWLIIVFDIAVTGLIARIFPFVDQFINPGFAAWYGPIIPLTVLGGIGLLVIARGLPQSWHAFSRQRFYWIGAGALAIMLVIGFAHGTIFQWMRANGLSQNSIYATSADVDAMRWVALNTPEDAVVLNYPLEGIWAAAITERDVIHKPATANAIYTTALTSRALLDGFWRDPVSSQAQSVLAREGIDYIVVPQIVSDPTAYNTAYRFIAPATADAITNPRRADYVDVVYENNGALVLQMNSDNE